MTAAKKTHQGARFFLFLCVFWGILVSSELLLTPLGAVPHQGIYFGAATRA
jgi:hypothetical protein